MSPRKKAEQPEGETAQINIKGIPVEVLEKLKTMAFNEGVDYQEVYLLAFTKLIEAYEAKNGKIKIRPKGAGLKDL
jgi:acyl-CoA hydrolase